MDLKDKEIIESLCGNNDIYINILLWLKNFNYNNKISISSCIIIAGSTCIGKTYSINKICEHLNCEIISIDNSNCYSSYQLNDIIYKSTTSSLVQVLTNNIRNKIIIIDNFDCMFMADKTINLTLLKILTDKKYKNIPILCITNNDIIKKIGEIKKVCKIYNLQIPLKKDINNILFKKGHNSKAISVLYDKSNGNLEKLFEDSYKKKDEIIYSDIIEDNSDINILYDNNFDRKRIRRIICKDIWMIPLKFHENLIADLNKRKITLSQKNEFYKKFIEIICIYDYYTFNNNTEICIGLLTSCVFYLSLFKYKKNSVSNIGNFTKILSYLSLQKKNIKYAYNSCNFPLYQISNYHINLCNRKFICFN
jgi:nucleoside-triphosphatase THEP1